MASRKAESESGDTKRRKDPGELLLCLNPTCKAKWERNDVSNCKVLGKETNASLMEEHHRGKKVRIEHSSKKQAEREGNATQI